MKLGSRDRPVSVTRLHVRCAASARTGALRQCPGFSDALAAKHRSPLAANR